MLTHTGRVTHSVRLRSAYMRKQAWCHGYRAGNALNPCHRPVLIQITQSHSNRLRFLASPCPESLVTVQVSPASTEVSLKITPVHPRASTKGEQIPTSLSLLTPSRQLSPAQSWDSSCDDPHSDILLPRQHKYISTLGSVL